MCLLVLFCLRTMFSFYLFSILYIEFKTLSSAETITTEKVLNLNKIESILYFYNLYV